MLQYHATLTRALSVALGSNESVVLISILERLRATGRRVGIAGNGGSSATAQHLAADWSRSGGVRTIDISASLATITACANDDGYGSVFEHQVAALLDSGDAIVLISTSGKSANILRAAEAARATRVFVIALTGRRSSPLARLADIELCADSEDADIAEDVHIALGHAVCRALARSRTTTTSERGGRATSPEVTPDATTSPLVGS